MVSANMTALRTQETKINANVDFFPFLLGRFICLGICRSVTVRNASAGCPIPTRKIRLLQPSTVVQGEQCQGSIRSAHPFEALSSNRLRTHNHGSCRSID